MEITFLGTGAPLHVSRATTGMLVTADGCAPLLIDTCGGFELARNLNSAGFQLEDDGALRASNDAAVSIVPPIMPQGGFSPLRLEGWRVRRDLPDASFSLSLLPACTVRRSVCLRPSCFSVDPPKVGSVDAITAPPCGGILHLPQGPSLRSGLCFPGHLHLIGPIRPTRGHISTSSHCDLYEMPQLCGSA